MITAILSMTTLVFAVKYLGQSLANTALIHYMETKGHKLPDEDEVREHTKYAVKKILHIKL